MTNRKIRSTRFSNSPDGEVHVTLKNIAANCGFSEDVAAESIAELEAAGLIKRIAADKYILLDPNQSL